MLVLRHAVSALVLALLGTTPVLAQKPSAPPKPPPSKPTPDAKPAVPTLPARLPLCGLAPSKLVPDLCLLKYPVSTTSPECQAFLDQGLGYYYSYVWMEAVRSLETATVYDPNCALAWWELSRAFEKWGRNDKATETLLKADALKGNASHREQQLILARMQEKGQAPGVGDQEARKKAAINTIDNLLALHDDDEEAWFYRAHLAGGYGFGGVVGAVPFFKALLQVNPLHPGANHELVHFYENMHRPALGWPYAENYIKSSPGIPHPFHMQAHLATRIGRWDKTSDRSSRAIELERAYHKEMNVRPNEDQQYPHHLEVLTISLIHDGRFAEARAMKEEAKRCGYQSWLPWFTLHVAERNWPEAFKIIDHYKRDKATSSYMKAIVYLRQGDVDRARPEVEVLRHEYQKHKQDRKLELNLWETQGLLLCRTGAGDAGVKLLERAVQKTKNDYYHHAWGNGAYYMEAWGVGALAAGKLDVAEEAFLEALAHDAGSVRAAMGLQVICERQNRGAEAKRYAELAHKFWSRAAAKDFEAELSSLRQPNLAGPKTTSARGTSVQLVRSARTSWTLVPQVMLALVFPLTTAVAEGPCVSGLQPGQRPGPYAAIVSAGPNRGQLHCFICETADKPAVVVFARTMSEPLGKLVQGLDKAVLANKAAGLRSWVTFLSEDQPALDPQVVKWGKQHGISNVSLAIFEDADGPPAYKLVREADVTVLLFVKQKVMKNFAFRASELDTKKLTEVLKSIPDITARK